jgi:HemY protein
MLKRIITIVFLLTVAGFAASFLSNQPGVTVLEWLGWRIEARTSVLMVIVIAVIILAITLDRIIGMIAGLPSRISGSLTDRRLRQGNQALAIGLVAASAGDGREALRQAKRAKRLMGEDPLTHLLAAQAATLTGDAQAASRYFEALSEDRQTAFFGKAGLMRLEAERGDHDAALDAGREAFALNNNTPSFAKALYALAARQSHWDEALDALSVAERDPSMDKAMVSRGYAALYYSQAQNRAQKKDDDAAVLALLKKALKHDPGLTPAVLDAAARYTDMGKMRQARQVLTTGFAHTPHPSITRALFELLGGDAKALSTLIKQTDQNGNPADGLIEVAALAVMVELWGEARRLLALVAADDRHLRYWQVYADFADRAPPPPKGKTASSDEDEPDRHHALTMAAKAKRPKAWQCSACHHHSETWQAHCPDCGHFAAMVWR